MKKRIASIALSLAMCLTLLPTAAYADDVSEGGAFDSQSDTGNGAATVAGSNEAVDTTKNTVVYTGENETTTVVRKVSDSDELKNALNDNDNSITEIDITADFTYNDSIATGDKKIVVNEGVTLTISGSITEITGTIVNNGTIKITGRGQCIWKAKTEGSGQIKAENKIWTDYETYVDYGCVPDAMLEGSNCRINIVKTVSIQPTVTLPETMTVGDTITPTVTNLIDGVDISKVFQYKWKDGNGSQIYNGAAKPTLTEAGTLKLNLAAKSLI